MPEFTVLVSRTVYEEAEFKVEAATPETAKTIAEMTVMDDLAMGGDMFTIDGSELEYAVDDEAWCFCGHAMSRHTFAGVHRCMSCEEDTAHDVEPLHEYDLAL